MKPLRRLYFITALAVLLALPLFSHNVQQQQQPFPEETLLQLALDSSGLRDDAAVIRQVTVPLGKWLTLNDHRMWLSSGDDLSPDTPVYVVLLEGYPKRSLINTDTIREVRAVAINAMTGTTFRMSLFSSVDEVQPALFGEGMMPETELITKATAWGKNLGLEGEASGIWLPLSEWQKITRMNLQIENRPAFVVSMDDYSFVLDGETGALIEAWGFFVDLSPASDAPYPALGYSPFIEVTAEPTVWQATAFPNQPFTQPTITPLVFDATPTATPRSARSLRLRQLRATADSIVASLEMQRFMRNTTYSTMWISEWRFTCSLPGSYVSPQNPVFVMVSENTNGDQDLTLTIDAINGRLISLLTVHSDVRARQNCEFRFPTPTPTAGVFVPSQIPPPMELTQRAMPPTLAPNVLSPEQWGATVVVLSRTPPPTFTPTPSPARIGEVTAEATPVD